jgi:hypothetical protein
MVSCYFSAVTVSEKKYRAQSVYEISHTNSQFSGNVVALLKQVGIFTAPEPGIL